MCENRADVVCGEHTTFDVLRTANGEPVKTTTGLENNFTHLTPKKKYRHLLWRSESRMSPTIRIVGSPKYHEPVKFKEGKVQKPANNSSMSSRRLPVVGRIRHPKNKQDDFNRICLVCTLPAEYYNSGAISCESCKMFFRRNVDKLHLLQCVATRSNLSTLDAVDDMPSGMDVDSFNETKNQDWMADLKCDLRQTGKKRLCALCRLKKCFLVGMRPINHGSKGSLENHSSGTDDSNVPLTMAGDTKLLPSGDTVPKLAATTTTVIPKKAVFENDSAMLSTRLSVNASIKPPSHWQHDAAQKCGPFLTSFMNGEMQRANLSVNWRSDKQLSDSEEDEDEDDDADCKAPSHSRDAIKSSWNLESSLNGTPSSHNDKHDTVPNTVSSNHNESLAVAHRTSYFAHLQQQTPPKCEQRINNPPTFPQRRSSVRMSSTSLSIVNGFQLGTSLFYLAESDPFLQIILHTPKDTALATTFWNVREELSQPLQLLLAHRFTPPQSVCQLDVWNSMRHFAEELSVQTLAFCQCMPPLIQWSTTTKKSILKTRLTVMVCHLSILFADSPHSDSSWNAALSQYSNNASLLQSYLSRDSASTSSVFPTLSLFITRMNEVLQNDLQLRLIFLALKLFEVLPIHKQHLASEQLYNDCVRVFHRFALQLWRAFAASAPTHHHAQQRWQSFSQLFAWSRHHFDVGCVREVSELHSRPEMGDFTRCLVALVDSLVK